MNFRHIWWQAAWKFLASDEEKRQEERMTPKERNLVFTYTNTKLFFWQVHSSGPLIIMTPPLGFPELQYTIYFEWIIVLRQKMTHAMKMCILSVWMTMLGISSKLLKNLQSTESFSQRATFKSISLWNMYLLMKLWMQMTLLFWKKQKSLQSFDFQVRSSPFKKICLWKVWIFFRGKKYHLPLYPWKEPQIMIHCLVHNADAWNTWHSLEAYVFI